MLTSSTKKQNRILIISLVLLLAGATILVAVVSSANRRHGDDPLPDRSDTGENTENSGGDPTETLPDKDGGDETGNPSGNESDSPSGADPDGNDDPDTPTFSDTGVLPTFSSPIKNGVMTKEFSGSSPVFSYTMNDYRTHGGIDIGCEVGTPVYAVADGEILSVTDDPMMGVTVCVRHSGGAVSKYMGLDKESLTLNEVGAVVSAGDVIGTSGDTALIESAEDPHIHFELTVGGEPKNPTDYFAIDSIADVFED